MHYERINIRKLKLLVNNTFHIILWRSFMKANEIVSVLSHFKDSKYQKLFIDGPWGIGKTKYVLDFKKAYPDVCYVSLFGKKDTESIIQEIYFQIIENLPNSKLKKHSRKIREHLSNINIEFHGLTISVPLIEKLHSTLYKELDKKGEYLIIFDDLERKHHDLDIKEVLGLIDSLSKIDNIKTILIAATNQLNDENDTFNTYKEKTIDRTYTIEKYADEAPGNILGEEVWNVISALAEQFNFSNLRTFEKTNLFLKEVLSVISDDHFTIKFTRDDIYKMCFATVFFQVEHKGKMELLDSDNDSFLKAHYQENTSGIIEYINDYVLKRSLGNDRNKNLLPLIKKWYDSGSFSEEKIIREINLINSYKESPKNFYSSEEEILELITSSKDYIDNLVGTENINEIFSNLSIVFPWCQILSIDFGISNEDIIYKMKTNISNHINIEKTVYKNKIDFWNSPTEGTELFSVSESINESIEIAYFNDLLKQIKELFHQENYKDYYYLKILIDSINQITFSSREIVLESLDDNDFFFPVPSGKITDQQWQWCHFIVNLIAVINKQKWIQEDYFDKFSAYIFNLEITQKDKMLKHRIKHLLGYE